MKKIFTFSPLFALLLAVAGFLTWTTFSRAEFTPHIIINEVQISGASSNDEFIELFNPADAPIDLEGYKLMKKTKGGSESTLVSAAKFSGIIEARGYFLVAHPDFKDEISADLTYSGSTYYISNDNTILLYDQSGALLDKVGFGAASDFETAPAPNPDSNQSIERTDFRDTNDNAADFSINISPSPQNKSLTESDGEESGNNSESPENTKDNNDTAPDTSILCADTSTDIRLNEIFPYPESGEEFVEVANTGEKCVDISGWKIMDEAGHKKEFPANSIVDPGKYLALEGNFYLNNGSDTVYLLDKNGNAKNDALDYKSYARARKGISYSFDRESWQWTSSPTPGAENIFKATEDEEENSASGTGSETENATAGENIYLNEVMPNPKGSPDNEYIEIASDAIEPADLFGWRLKDRSKSKGYQFKEHIVLNHGEYFVIYRSEAKIALNNSNESVYLYNPKGEVVSSVTFDKSPQNASYNFDGEKWRWSKYLTPGKKNKFDSEPLVKIKKPKNVFKDISVQFSAQAKDKETKKLKYAWDFGDGKKSRLKKTFHKYLDTGEYKVTLSVTDDSQTVEKIFVINVKKYPRPNLEIVKIVPNPAGNDSKEETIDIRNNSGKKVSLDEWKIATGPGGKIYNHLISDGITLNPGETKTITREMCKFSLNNKAGKIQLVMPDGKVIDEVEYQKDPPNSPRDSKRAGKIADDEAYAKIRDEWQWMAPNTPGKTDNLQETADPEETQDEESKEQPDGEVLGTVTDENIDQYTPFRERYTSEDAFIFFNFFGLLNYKPQQEVNYCPMNQASATFAYF